MHSSPDSARDRATPPRFSAEVELASGGMGFVQIARCSTPGYPEVLAVKRLLPHLGRDDELVRAFLDEAWMTASLQHPNVVALIASGKDEQGLFLALELVKGPPLSSLLRAAGPLPGDVAAYVARSMAAGLGAAHSLVGPDGQTLGIVHRDVTPSNVLLGSDGSVKITDFGVAKANRYFARTRTATGVLKGKVPYMSPEYALARPVDARSDLYSVGVVLFEMLTGTRPFDSESDVLVLKKVTEEPAPPLSAWGVDPELAHIVDLLLQKRPEDRFSDAESLAFELDAYLAQRGKGRDALQRELAELIARTVPGDLDRIETLVALLVAENNPNPTAILAPSRPPPSIIEAQTRPVTLVAVPPPVSPQKPSHARALAIGVGAGVVLGLFVLAYAFSRGPEEEGVELERVGPARSIAFSAPEPVPLPVPSASVEPSIAPEKSAKKPNRPPARPRRPCTKDNPDYPMCLKR